MKYVSHGDDRRAPRQSRSSWIAALTLGSACVLSNASAKDAKPASPVTLDTVQVIATRTPRAASDVPASISVVAGTDYRTDSTGANLSEKLLGVPGILARDRQNYAQDAQVSIRGFGARASFGVRGVRLYVDGIPATMPDGQGQTSNFNFSSANRIEILRGPFSALYGNSSGGVVQIFTADGSAPSEQQATVTAGAFGTRRLSLDARGLAGDAAYNFDATDFHTSGFRAHSAAERISANAKFAIPLADGAKLSLLVNTLSIPQALDPLGLTRAQFAADPRQATSVAIDFNTRKSVRQAQAGAIFEKPLSDTSAFRLLAYAGDRAVTQFLAIPVAAQANPLHGGGVVVLASPFAGADLRYTMQATLAGKPLEGVAGVSYDQQDQHRRGYENFVGTVLGVQGAPRRDEQDRVQAFDEYAQATWNAGGMWSLFAGLRHSAVRFAARDRFITAANPDDSGRLAFSAVTPVAGVDWHPQSALHVYASYGQGFETPTFDELGYRPDGGAGLNFALRAARSRNSELGLKWDVASRSHIDATLYRADTRNELAVDTNAGGRSTYQNVGHARRTGGEIELTTAFGGLWHARFAYTYLDARFRDAFLTCIATPCAAPNTLVPAGTQIPGVPREFASAKLSWGHEDGLQANVDGQYVGSVSVNNPGTQRASGHAVFGAGIGYSLHGEHGEFHGFLRVDNLFDRRYAGSIIVNDGNGRYFEPAPGRTLMVGMELRRR